MKTAYCTGARIRASLLPSAGEVRGSGAAILSPAVHLPPPEPAGSLPPPASTPRLTAPECTTQPEAPPSPGAAASRVPPVPRVPRARRPLPHPADPLRPRTRTCDGPGRRQRGSRAPRQAVHAQKRLRVNSRGARSARSAPAAPPSPAPRAPTWSQSLSTAILPFPRARARTSSSPLRRCQRRRDPGETEGTAGESARSRARDGDSPATARPPPPASHSPAPARGSRSPARPPLYRKCRPLPAGPPLTSPRAASRRPGRRCLLPPVAAPRSPAAPAPSHTCTRLRQEPAERGGRTDADPPQRSHPRARHRWARPRQTHPRGPESLRLPGHQLSPCRLLSHPLFPKTSSSLIRLLQRSEFLPPGRSALTVSLFNKRRPWTRCESRVSLTRSGGRNGSCGPPVSS